MPGRIGPTLKAGFLAATVVCIVTTSVFAKDRVLKIYNWEDYIGEETIAQFEAKTGIDVVYDLFDSNEILEARLLSGRPATI